MRDTVWEVKRGVGARGGWSRISSHVVGPESDSGFARPFQLPLRRRAVVGMAALMLTSLSAGLVEPGLVRGQDPGNLATFTLPASPSAQARAQATSLTVRNDGQPGLVSSGPQPPLSLSPRGSCTAARTEEEANGGGSPCPPGTWPEPGGDWSPTLQVASGDRLEFSFDAAQDRLQVTATTNHRPGQSTPDGTPVRNETVGRFEITQSEDPTRWRVRVPELDLRAESENFISVAVTAAGGEQGSNFAFSVRTPRFDNDQERCGTAYFGPGQTGYRCYPAQYGPKGPPPAPAPTTSDGPGQQGARFGIGRGCELSVRGVVIGLRASRSGALRLLLRLHGRPVGRRQIRIEPGRRRFVVPITRWFRGALARTARTRVEVVARFQPNGSEKALGARRACRIRTRATSA